MRNRIDRSSKTIDRQAKKIDSIKKYLGNNNMRVLELFSGTGSVK